MSCESNTIAVKELQDTVQRFLGWLEGNGYAGYDPYDIWGSRIGLLARRLYYARRASGYFLVAPMLVMEMIRPKTRALFLERQRFATADAQLALGFLNLYNLTKTNDFLAKSVSLCEDLVNTSIPGYSGHCWGYPFDWQTHKGVWKKNTPFITVTPYCFNPCALPYSGIHA